MQKDIALRWLTINWLVEWSLFTWQRRIAVHWQWHRLELGLGYFDSSVGNAETLNIKRNSRVWWFNAHQTSSKHTAPIDPRSNSIHLQQHRAGQKCVGGL